MKLFYKIECAAFMCKNKAVDSLVELLRCTRDEAALMVHDPKLYTRFDKLRVDAAAYEVCVSCHDRDLVARINSARGLATTSEVQYTALVRADI